MTSDDKVRILFLVISGLNVAMEYAKPKRTVFPFVFSVLLYGLAIYLFMW